MNNIGKADIELLKKLYPDNNEELLKKIENHYPIQYLIGYVDFLDTKLKVNENVLIPRFETELLVEKAIHYLKNKNYKTALDIGTGSGVIAINLKKNLNINIDACDISDKALQVAQENANLNHVKLNFYKTNILKEELMNTYDCIISNPPYVREDEYTSPETRYEPSIALYAKNKGLEFYERILYLASKYLNKNGTIIFEIGANQANDIQKFALKYLPNSSFKVEKDYNNFDRFIFITKS